MEEYIKKAKVLIEALPYIKEFYGKTVVIKYGGSAMTDEKIKKAVIQDIVLMKLVGINVVIVHGGGPEISRLLNQVGKKSEFIDGLRVTDAETMDIVQMVLAGKINKDIVGYIQANGLKAAGICGKDGNLLKTEKLLVNGKDAGFIGNIVSVDVSIIETMINSDFIPVISPIGSDEQGHSYNINADSAAVAIAGALKAQKLVFLTDVEGVLKDVNDKSSLISLLKVSEVPELIEKNIISGGMAVKVNSCVEGIKKGVKTVHILDGSVEHSLLLEIFTQGGIGTMVEE